MLKLLFGINLKSHTRPGGYTLVEVLVAAGLAAMVLLVATSMIFGSLTLGDRTRENISTQNDLNSAFYHIRSLTSRAIDVRLYTGGSLRGLGSEASEGYVRTFTYERFNHATDPAGYEPLMFFNVENQHSSYDYAHRNSNPQPAAVFFKPPTVSQPGQLVISSRRNSGNLDPLDGSTTQLRYDGVVGLYLSGAQVSSAAKNILESITLTAVVRYFIGGASILVKKWCPPMETLPECQNGAPYRDIRREIVLTFDNNRREVQFQSFEFGMGTYLFQPTIKN